MKYLTTVQVAKELSVSTRSIERWRINGKLIPVKRTLGNHSRYRKEDICQFKQERLLKEMMS